MHRPPAPACPLDGGGGGPGLAEGEKSLKKGVMESVRRDSRSLDEQLVYLHMGHPRFGGRARAPSVGPIARMHTPRALSGHNRLCQA